MSKRTEWLLVALWVLAVTLLVYLATGKPGLGIDDAQIFFTYAQNLAHGEGLIYSPGIPPAEGYTSSLWMAICSLMFWVHANEAGVLAVSLLLLFVTQVLAFSAIEKLLPEGQARKAKLIYAVLVTASPAYLSWTTITLMDTGVWSTLIVAMVFVLLFPPATVSGWLVAGVPFALAPLARPEAMVVAPAILVLLWLKLRMQGRRTAPVWYILASLCAATLALTLFRLAYFGYPLPNTYYAKVSSSTWYNLKIGTTYLGKYLFGGNIVLIAAITCVPFGWRLLVRVVRALPGRSQLAPADPLDDARQALAAVCLLMLALPVTVGGDHFSLSRFYQPVWPLFSLLLALSVTRLLSARQQRRQNTRRSSSTWLAPATVVGLAALLSISSYRDSWLAFARYGSPIKREFTIGSEGKQTGATLDALFTANRSTPPVIGVVAAGGIARTYRGPIVDLMGLNNAYIAHLPGTRIGVKDHAAFQKAAFYALPIDVLLSSPNSEWNEAVLKRIFYDPQFVEAWRYGVVYLKDRPSQRFEGFYSRKLVASFDTAGNLGFYDTLVFSKADDRWEKTQIEIGKSEGNAETGSGT